MTSIFINPFMIFSPALAELFRAQKRREIAISKKLGEHQALEEWQYREAARRIHDWSKSMNLFFFDDELEYPSISFNRTRKSILGHYNLDINGFGLEHELNLNSLYLGNPSHDVAATLLHELTHMYCKINGLEKRGNYHNKNFRGLMKSFGFSVTPRGCHNGSYAPGSKFEEWMKINGVNEEPFIPDLPYCNAKVSETKLKKYSCRCDPPFNIRVARKEFRAICLICNTEFTQDKKDF